MEKDSAIRLKNSIILKDLDDKLIHLPPKERKDLKSLLIKYKDLFSDESRRTNAPVHYVVLNEERSIKQHPCRINPRKLVVLRKEVDYMLSHGIIEPSQSE